MSELPQKVLEQIAGISLPSLPHVLLKLLRAFSADQVNVAELCRLINLDRALRARILALAGARGERGSAAGATLEQSLIGLGLDTIKTITICGAVAHVFGRQPALPTPDAKRLWAHSLRAALIARMLAETTHYANPEEAYLAGLLHDIGQLALATGFPEQYADILALSDESAQLTLERQRFGTSHTEVGFWLIDRYQPRSIVRDAALYHHEPIERITDAHALVKIAAAAHALASDHAEESANAVGLAASLFKLNSTQVLALAERARQDARQEAEYLGFEGGAKSAAEGARRKKAAETDSGEDDRLIEAQLAEEVRSHVLLSSVRQAITAAAGEHAMLCAIGKSAQILFGIPHTLFFIQEGGGFLVGKSIADDTAIVDQMVVPLAAGKSLIADAVKNGLPRSSFGGKGGLAIIDEQVIRATQNDGILCTPLIVGDNPLGAVVFGLDAIQAASLIGNTRFMMAFANLAAAAIDAHKTRQMHEKFIEANQEAEYAGRSRKVVHEISNPLSIIKNYIKILGLKLDRDDSTQQDLDVLNEEIDRVAGIVRGLSDPRRPVVDMTGEADLNLVVSEVTELCEKTLFGPHRIGLNLDLDKAMPVIVTDKNGVKQILLNLIKNAVEAMPEGGELSIASAGGVYRDGAIYVELRVADNGPGIPAQVLSRLFEPVQSTKGDGHAGLGLAIVKTIVKELRGFVTCRSSSQGTSFEILLPKNPPPSNG